MFEHNAIAEKIIEHGISLIGDIVRDASDERKFYAFINIVRDKEGIQRPSNHTLGNISRDFEKDNILLSFVLLENNVENVQSTIKYSLFRSFPELVRNAFVASEVHGLSVWVEPKKTLNAKEQESICNKIQEICQVLEINLAGVRITSSENTPTHTACLSAIRLKSPINLQALREELSALGFHIPNEEWLSNMLDKLRKTGLVMRRKDGQYLLTLSGLRSLGSAKNRSSPDVRRSLDFARRHE